MKEKNEILKDVPSVDAEGKNRREVGPEKMPEVSSARRPKDQESNGIKRHN